MTRVSPQVILFHLLAIHAADSDEARARALGVLRKWFGETPTADEVLSSLR
jgi:hypothetical protein